MKTYNMDKDTPSTRRSKKKLEELIINATHKLISKVGFSNITINAILKEADVDQNVFYRHFGTLDTLFEIISRKYDFWINDTIDLTKLHVLGDRKFLVEGFKELYIALDKHIVMQKLLLWELEENNDITRKSADMRETLNLNLLGYYEKVFHSSNVDFNAVSAMLIAGMYYIVLHKNISTFSSIDFTSDKGIKRLLDTIEMVINLIFDKIELEQRQSDLVKKMQEDGLSQSKIDKYLDILQIKH